MRLEVYLLSMLSRAASNHCSATSAPGSGFPESGLRVTEQRQTRHDAGAGRDSTVSADSLQRIDHA